MKSIFNVGDRVVAVADHPDGNRKISKGDTGTICHINKFLRLPIGVKWDNEVSAHGCSGRCKLGYGWWVRETDIQHALPDLPDFDIADVSAMFI